MIYSFYYCNFINQNKQPTNRIYYIDKKNWYVRKRQKEILVHFQYLIIQHSELFFYQQLLLKLPAQSENDLKKSYLSYRTCFEIEFSTEYSLTLNYI